MKSLIKAASLTAFFMFAILLSNAKAAENDNGGIPEFSVTAPVGVNYIWHMLSIGGIDYFDVDYMQKYSNTISAENLLLLKQSYTYLQMKNNPNGFLAFPFIILPAYLNLNSEDEIQNYYYALSTAIEKNNFAELLFNYKVNFEDIYLKRYKGYLSISSDSISNLYNANDKENLKKLALIFADGFHNYLTQVWPIAKQELENAIPNFQSAYSKTAKYQSWKEITGLSYLSKKYESVLCYAMQKGLNGVTVGYGRDVFYHNPDSQEFKQFLNHKIGTHFLSNLYNEYKTTSDTANKRFNEAFEVLVYHYNRRMIGRSELKYNLDIPDDFIYLLIFEKGDQLKLNPGAMLIKGVEEYR